MTPTSLDLPQDPLSCALRAQVDVTLLQKNLTLTVEERLEQLQELCRFAAELRRAGRALREQGGA